MNRFAHTIYMSESVWFPGDAKMRVKIFRVKGTIQSPSYQTNFVKDVRALKPEDAIDKIYKEFGSQHRVKRIHMKVTSIQEISVDETEDSVIKSLADW
jgi:large subunit ribosomal protein LX